MQNRKWNGGMAIDIKENIQQVVKKSRTRHRKDPDHAHQNADTTQTTIILNTQPDEAGNAIDIRKEYWDRIKQILYQTKRIDFLIWATGNNGHFSRNPHTDDKIIGKWTIATEMGKFNGWGDLPDTVEITTCSLQTPASGRKTRI